MELFKNREEFEQIVNLTSEHFGIDNALIEKDYYVTCFLKRANDVIPGLVFKGGTSLSKCYGIIDRFSEDLDLTLDLEHFSQSKKRNALRLLINICEELNLTLVNRQKIEKHTHGNFNLYEIEYPNLYKSSDVDSGLKVEMTYIQRVYPCEKRKASSYITDFLLYNGNIDIIEEYHLEPFEVQVQSLERTLIDKVFALCDYYLLDSSNRNSRHIYDISKILETVNLDNQELKLLVDKVRKERKTNRTCVSAQDGVNISLLLREIISKQSFKKDYEGITMKLLMKQVGYDEAIEALEKIIKSKLFD